MRKFKRINTCFKAFRKNQCAETRLDLIEAIAAAATEINEGRALALIAKIATGAKPYPVHLDLMAAANEMQMEVGVLSGGPTPPDDEEDEDDKP
jgi:hypothetical protein